MLRDAGHFALDTKSKMRLAVWYVRSLQTQK